MEAIRSSCYPIPYKTREEMENEIQTMHFLEVIEPSTSPYSSPVIFVPKKDGSVRFCIDFRKPNEVTEFDANPMQNIEEVIDKLSGHKYFTKIDLSKCYWHVEFTDESALFPLMSLMGSVG